MVKIQPTKFQAVCLEGFVKLRKIQKFEKNSRVGGLVGSSPNSDSFIFLEIVCFFFVFL